MAAPKPLPGFDARAGHIHVARGAMPLTEIDWALLACPLDETFEEYVEPHLLSEIESRGKWHNDSLEFYISKNDLKLHTDDCLWQSDRVMGMILECEPDFTLTTGRSHIPATAGDVYLLEPSRLHGTKTAGFYAFVATNVDCNNLSTPNEFRARIIRKLEEMCLASNVHFKPQ